MTDVMVPWRHRHFDAGVGLTFMCLWIRSLACATSKVAETPLQPIPAAYSPNDNMDHSPTDTHIRLIDIIDGVHNLKFATKNNDTPPNPRRVAFIWKTEVDGLGWELRYKASMKDGSDMDSQ
jgi:hypothetical protein